MGRVYEESKHSHPLQRGAVHFYHTDDIAGLFGDLDVPCRNLRQRDGEARHGPVNERFVKSCVQCRTHNESRDLALFLWFGVADGKGCHRIFRWLVTVPNDLYLGYISSFIKPGGHLAIVVPSLADELSGPLPPAHLDPYWDWDCCSFHSPAWWRRHWEKTRLMTVEVADALPDGWKLWLEWNELCAEHGRQEFRELASKEAEMLRIDDGRTLCFARVIAQRPASSK
jgi:hypothetical protein